MAGKLWRLDYFTNRDDLLPSRAEIVEAINEDAAADMAAANMDDAMRVDIIRTITKK